MKRKICYSLNGDYMVIEGKQIEIKTYTKFLDKLKGLMFKKDFGYGLKIRCNGIHTFFMLKPIDVILTDKDNTILAIYKNVKPNRIILPKKSVYYTYELPKGTITNLEINKKLQ